MTYTVEQGVAVAMFNAGVKEAEGLIGLPTAKAKLVVEYLRQMGFDIDATRHNEGHRVIPGLTVCDPLNDVHVMPHQGCILR